MRVCVCVCRVHNELTAFPSLPFYPNNDNNNNNNNNNNNVHPTLFWTCDSEGRVISCCYARNIDEHNKHRIV